MWMWFLVMCAKRFFRELNAYQREVIVLFAQTKTDVFVNLSTGYRKSLIYQALPFVYRVRVYAHAHVLRMSSDQNLRIAVTWTPEGKRKRGRPKETWRRTVEGERQKMGFDTWGEAVIAARDRVGWRKQVNGPILPEEIRN